ncbi:DUF1798 family protein [Aeribacillus pallidus]|uniref:DUF1798 family protein n=1 Tax=Aeribacillus pallidus TaxID=33936 RepID=UPI001022F537|nr:DUF1798 family protein [Aeribacillus pallidus]RZI53092.1 DUF1798 family protein [Aeribacillus pallidus]
MASSDPKKCSTLRENQEGRTGIRFFAEIKPSVDKILPILDEWEIVAKKWINKYHPRYLHSQQIDTAKEHIENIVIQSFFQDTSKVRFKNIKESAEYTLRSMIREMEKK